MNSAQSVLAVVVFYHPTIDQVKNIYNTLKQVNNIYIFWNEFQEKDKEYLFLLDNPNITIQIFNENLGIAKGFNEGIDHMKTNDFDYLLTLDQDSIITENMVRNLLLVFEQTKLSETKTGIVFPVTQNILTGKKHIRCQNNEEFSLNYDSYSSGCLIKSEVFKKGLKMDEKLFIYHVDSDFNLKVKHFNFASYESKNAILLHNEGQMSQVKLFGKKFGILNHSLIAHYYLSRNEILMLKKYFFKDTQWSIYSILWFTKYKFKAIMFEKQRIRILKSTLIGIYDGFINKNGRMDRKI
ncbi:MAG: glycosyltransferase [Patescibacteria group bacterium]